MSYPYDRASDYFEPPYVPQLNSNPYDFYQPPLEPGEPIIPYGWRPDWNRAQPATSRVEWVTVPNNQFSTNLSNTVPLPQQLNTVPQNMGYQGGQLHLNSHPIQQLDDGGFSSTMHKNEQSFRRPIPSKMTSQKEQFGANKPFICQLCGKSFSQAANLTAHKRVHTGEKPFSCSVCHRPFSQSSSLVTHKRTHTGERPYPCPHCDKAFTDSSTLTKHLRTHTGNKPYGCPLCLMRFTQSGNLHRHMKTHKGGHH